MKNLDFLLYDAPCDLCAQMKYISFSFSELPQALGHKTCVFSSCEVCENRMKIGCGVTFGQTQRFFQGKQRMFNLKSHPV